MSGIRIATLRDVWDNTVERFPRKAAAIDRDQPQTYGQLDEKVRALSRHLHQELGVGRGDKVAVAMPNCLEFLIAYWAVIRLGAVVVPVNFRMTPDGMAFVIADSDASVLFVHKDVWRTLRDARDGFSEVRHIVSVEFEEEGCVPFGSLLLEMKSDTPDPRPDIAPDDLAVIVYTSGTTGRPKGPMLTHDNLIYNIRNTIISHSFRHEDVHMLVVPLFHCTGLNSIITSSAYLGSTVVLAPRPETAELIPMIERHRVTTFLGVPTLFYFIVTHKRLADHDLSSLRLIAYSGSPMPTATIRALRENFPRVALHNFFGLTETISITSVLPDCDALTHPRSVGKALPDVGQKIIDDGGSDVPPGTIGELCFRKENVVQGYWKRPGLLEESMTPDGWFRTGDYALIDEDGYVFLKGRKKEMIIVGGENVYAVEVEHVLCEHPNALEAAVVGVEATGIRAYLGELVKAVVVVKPGEKLTELDVKRHCSERLETYKVPQIVEFRDQLPRTPSGKVRKRDLK